jgi:hypothetical protein
MGIFSPVLHKRTFFRLAQSAFGLVFVLVNEAAFRIRPRQLSHAPRMDRYWGRFP